MGDKRRRSLCCFLKVRRSSKTPYRGWTWLSVNLQPSQHLADMGPPLEQVTCKLEAISTADLQVKQFLPEVPSFQSFDAT